MPPKMTSKKMSAKTQPNPAPKFDRNLSFMQNNTSSLNGVGRESGILPNGGISRRPLPSVVRKPN